MKILKNRDFFSGIMMTAIGLFFFLGAFNYAMGTLQRMGSGMFPLIVGAVLTVLGIALTVTSIRLEQGPAHSIAWRPVAAVTGSIIAFALLYDHLGLLPAVAATVAIGAFGDPSLKYRELALILLLYVAMAWLIFIFGLGLPMPAFRIR